MKLDFKFSYQLQNAMAPKDALPSSATIDKKIETLTTFWKTDGLKIEQSFKKHTNLVFAVNYLSCYLNTKTSFSDPLSIYIENVEGMKDTLIHELIHQLFIQNEKDKTFDKKWKKYWNNPLFKDETRLTKSHIYLHAVHLLVTRDLFPKREKIIIKYSKTRDYVKAWEYVTKYGPEKIIELFDLGLTDLS